MNPHDPREVPTARNKSWPPRAEPSIVVNVQAAVVAARGMDVVTRRVRSRPPPPMEAQGLPRGDRRAILGAAIAVAALLVLAGARCVSERRAAPVAPVAPTTASTLPVESIESTGPWPPVAGEAAPSPSSAPNAVASAPVAAPLATAAATASAPPRAPRAKSAPRVSRDDVL
jgi:hypothetical protein